MQEDPLLRADARLRYNTRRLWSDQPSFEEAERLRLPSYLEAVGQAIDDRAEEMELMSSATQLVMLV